MRRKLTNIPTFRVVVPPNLLYCKDGKRYVSKEYVQKLSRKQLTPADQQSLAYAFMKKKYNTISEFGMTFINVDEPIGNNQFVNIFLHFSVEGNTTTVDTINN